MRLIDADELIEHAYRDRLDSRELIANMIRKAPTAAEFCEDCIDRKALGLTDFEILMCDGDYKKALELLLKKIEDAPSVQPVSCVAKVSFDKTELKKIVENAIVGVFPEPQKPKVGRWIKMSEGFSLYKCSKCEDVEFKQSKYCPNCGARMVESEEV